MSYKVLEQNGVLNENIDGAAFNNFCAKNVDGIIGGVLEECPMYLSSSNIISIGSGLLIIKGFRIKILEDGLHFSIPSGTTPGVTQIICSLTLNKDRSVLTEISLSEERVLKQDSILTEEEGKYEVEIGRFYWDGSSAKNLTRSISVIPVENIELAQTLSGNEADKAPSVKAVNDAFNGVAYNKDFGFVSTNMLDNSELIDGYIKYDFTIAQYGTSKYCKVEVSPNSIVSIFIDLDNPNEGIGGCVLFYSNDEVVGTTVLAAHVNGTYRDKTYSTITIPENVNKIGVNIKIEGIFDAIDTAVVCYGNTIIDSEQVEHYKGALFCDKFAREEIKKTREEIEKAKEETLKNNSSLHGLKVSLIGDSITEKNERAKINWAMWLENWCGCTVQNLGISSTGFSTTYGGKDPYINRISRIDADTDIIGVACSFNDMAFGNLGELADTGTSSVFGYANDFFTALLDAFPNTPIICYAQNPWWNIRFGHDAGDKFITGIKTICNKKGIPFYGDLYLNGSVLKPWISSNCEVYFKSDVNGLVDNTHPNSLGHSVIAKYLRPLFEQNAVNTEV